MNRLKPVACGFVFVLAFAAPLAAPPAVRAFSIEQQGCVEPPKLASLPPIPKLSGSPWIIPEETGKPWTAVFGFAGGGQTSVVWGCASQGFGTAENIAYSLTVVGRYGHGKAEEVVTLAVGKPTGTSQVQPWMGSHSVTTYLDCPAGDPWLLGKTCTVTGATPPIPGIKFKGPFPLTYQQVPQAEREQAFFQAFPPKYVLPTANQKFGNGQPVTVQLAKSGPVAATPVILRFTSGEWAAAKTFTRTMVGSSITVEGTAFGPGEWKVVANYKGDKSIGGVERAFFVQGGWGGGPSGGGAVRKPAPGAEGPLMPVPVPVPVPGRSRGN